MSDPDLPADETPPAQPSSVPVFQCKAEENGGVLNIQFGIGGKRHVFQLPSIAGRTLAHVVLTALGEPVEDNKNSPPPPPSTDRMLAHLLRAMLAQSGGTARLEGAFMHMTETLGVCGVQVTPSFDGHGAVYLSLIRPTGMLCPDCNLPLNDDTHEHGK